MFSASRCAYGGCGESRGSWLSRINCCNPESAGSVKVGCAAADDDDDAVGFLPSEALRRKRFMLAM